MAYRELAVVEVREILRRWLAKDGYRAIATALGADRKTVRRYVQAAIELGLVRDGSGRPLDDGLVAEVVSIVRPGAPPSEGPMRAHCRAHRELLEGWAKAGCQAPSLIRKLHRRTGVTVPLRTMQRFLADDLDITADTGTVRVTEHPPGQVLEIDFMQLCTVPRDGRQVQLHALVCVAAFSRHTFVWPCETMKIGDVIEGLEAAWAFFGGVFPVVVVDNPKTMVIRANPVSPVINETFLEYSQARGFLIDAARVRRPKDKPKVERTVQYVRRDGFAGERILDVAHARRHAAAWCRDVAGMRRHGTTRRQPAVVFEEEEKALLLPPPESSYDQPTWHNIKVGRDHAVCVAHALYSVPFRLRGRSLRIRVDRESVKMWDGAQLVKSHARVEPGTSAIDQADLPPGKAVAATRDSESLAARAEHQGEAIGEYARRILDTPLPWTKIRQVYRLLGLARRFGSDRVQTACRMSLDLDVVDVMRIERMLTRDLEGLTPAPPPPRGQVVRMRFGRDPSVYRATSPTEEGSDAS